MADIRVVKVGDSVLVSFGSGPEVLLARTNAQRLGQALLQVAASGLDVLDLQPEWIPPRDPR